MIEEASKSWSLTMTQARNRYGFACWLLQKGILWPVKRMWWIEPWGQAEHRLLGENHLRTAFQSWRIDTEQKSKEHRMNHELPCDTEQLLNVFWDSVFSYIKNFNPWGPSSFLFSSSYTFDKPYNLSIKSKLHYALCIDYLGKHRGYSTSGSQQAAAGTLHLVKKQKRHCHPCCQGSETLVEWWLWASCYHPHYKFTLWKRWYP